MCESGRLFGHRARHQSSTPSAVALSGEASPVAKRRRGVIKSASAGAASRSRGAAAGEGDGAVEAAQAVVAEVRLGGGAAVKAASVEVVREVKSASAGAASRSRGAAADEGDGAVEAAQAVVAEVRLGGGAAVKAASMEVVREVKPAVVPMPPLGCARAEERAGAAVESAPVAAVREVELGVVPEAEDGAGVEFRMALRSPLERESSVVGVIGGAASGERRSRRRLRAAAPPALARGARSAVCNRSRCLEGSAETASRSGKPFDTGTTANDAGSVKDQPPGRWLSVLEERARGLAYCGPKVDRAQLRVRTPNRFADALEIIGYHDQGLIAALRNFDCCGGFPLGYYGARDGDPIIVPNPASTYRNADALHGLMQKAYGDGTVMLFEERPPWRFFRSNPLFALPKKRFTRIRKGEWRVIKNNSAEPAGAASLNDCIAECPPVKLGSVVDFARRAVELKSRVHEPVKWFSCDAANAFPTWPVHWDDVCLQGCRWYDPRRPLPPYVREHGRPDPADPEGGMVWLFHATMELGTRSSMSWYCRIADAADALYCHPDAPLATSYDQCAPFETDKYVDDWVCCARAGRCGPAKQRYRDVQRLLGDPDQLLSLKKDATDGQPESTHAYTGVTFDVDAELLSSPAARVAAGIDMVRAILARPFCRTAALRSLVGSLTFAVRCAPRGKTFLRRLWDALRCTAAGPRRWTRVTRGMRADLQWFLRYWRDHNQVHAVPTADWAAQDDGFVLTDACGRVVDESGHVARSGGYGGVNLETNEYFAGVFPEEAGALSIHSLEAVTVAVAAELWGHEWRGRRIAARCDNRSFCDAINRGVARDATLMAVVRHLYFEELRGGFEMRARHIAGVDNCLADLASRARTSADWAGFRAQCVARVGCELTRVTPPPTFLPALLQRMRRAGSARRAAAACRGLTPRRA